MDENLTIFDLKQRWKKVLTITQKSVSNHPMEYRQLKILARNIVDRPLDIKDYLPTVKKLTHLLELMGDSDEESIFYLFNKRIEPSDIWQTSLLRVECRDLLAHLHDFDQWRIKSHRLKVVK